MFGPKNPKPYNGLLDDPLLPTPEKESALGDERERERRSIDRSNERTTDTIESSFFRRRFFPHARL